MVVDGFSYIFDNAYIKSTVVFSFMMLNATFLANVNRITPSVCRSNNSYSDYSMSVGFCLIKGRYNFFWYK